jgi:hypothetical protein
LLPVTPLDRSLQGVNKPLRGLLSAALGNSSTWLVTKALELMETTGDFQTSTRKQKEKIEALSNE